MWEKRATSAEGKTIRIAESSDMDSWKAVLRPCASFEKGVEFWKEVGWKGYFVPVPMSWYEVVMGLGTMIWDMVGYRRSFGETAKMMSS